MDPHRISFVALAALALLVTGCATSDPIGNRDDTEDVSTAEDSDVNWAPDTSHDQSDDYIPSKVDIDLGGDDVGGDDGSSDADGTEMDAEEDTTQPSGGLCDSCQANAECGGQNDLCLRNSNTGETLCGRACSGPADCPTGYLCAPIPNSIPQCVPEGDSCMDTEPPPTCDPVCSTGEQCVDGSCVTAGEYEAELQYCVDLVNQYRVDHGKSELTRSTALEDCAGSGVVSDSQTGQPHGHFSSTNGCSGTAFAENEIPGWNLQQYGSVEVVVREGTRMMMNEGPGGGHYENILGSHTSVGCGIHVTDGGEVWVIQDFR